MSDSSAWFSSCIPKFQIEWVRSTSFLNQILGIRPAATSHNNSVSAPPSAALRFATVLGPGTLSKRLISFASLLRADARRFWNIRSARTAPCCGQIALRATSGNFTRYLQLRRPGNGVAFFVIWKLYCAFPAVLLERDSSSLLKLF